MANPQELQRIIERLLTGEGTEAEKQALLQAFRNGNENVVNLASGERAVAILGNVADSTISTGDIVQNFYGHGLRDLPLSQQQWPFVVQASSERLAGSRNGSLAFQFGYAADEDVRYSSRLLSEIPQVAVWQRENACLILYGDSGQGKTWQLCALARCLSVDTPLIAVTANRDARALSQDVAHTFLSDFCDRDSSERLSDIAHHVRANGVTPSATWLYIAVDNVATSKEAVALYQEAAGLDGVRLVFTTSTEVAKALVESADLPNALFYEVPDFTEAEVRRYVVDDDPVRWHAIPIDMQRILRRPLLAYIYRSLAGPNGYDGENEYALYNDYFRKRLLSRLGHAGFRLATAHFVRAGLALWNGEKYPWRTEQVSSFGFSEALLDDLLRRGWFRQDSQNQITVWHDRLKQWLVAYAVADALLGRKLEATGVARKVALLLSRDPEDAPTAETAAGGMGYVPMDLLWHLAQRQKSNPSDAQVLNTLLSEVEKRIKDWRVSEAMYSQLLPTIGSAIAPAAFRRLSEVGTRQNKWQWRKWITACLVQLGGKAVSLTAIELLEHKDHDIRLAAAEILRNHPDANALPVLLKRHWALKETETAPETPDDEEGQEDTFTRSDIFMELNAIRRALHVCVPLDRDWLQDEINRLAPLSQPVSSLKSPGVLINLLRYTKDGGRCWRNCKEKLRPWTATGNRDVDLHCSREFIEATYYWKDADETDWLRERIDSDNGSVGTSCLHALIRISPATALERLAALPPDKIAYTGDWGLRGLIAQEPEATRLCLTRLAEDHEYRQPDYVSVFSPRLGGLSEAALSGLLDRAKVLTDSDADGETLWALIGCLSRVTAPSFLRALWRCDGSEWEAHLVRLYLNAQTTHDHRLEPLARLLFKIGGPGFTKIINQRIASVGHFRRLEGIANAHLRPDEETVLLLEALALYVTPKAETQGDSAAERYAYVAQKALATIKVYRPLIDSVVRRASGSPRDVLDAVDLDTPLSDVDMAPALEAIKNNAAAPGAILALGVGRRVDFIPHIVKVLNGEDVTADNDVTNACHYALAVMPFLNDEGIEALARRLPYTRSGWLLLHSLMNNGSEVALQILFEYLRARLPMFRTGPYSMFDIHEIVRVAKYLLTKPSMQSRSVALLRARFADAEILDNPAQTIAAELAPLAREQPALREALDVQQVRDYLLRAAFQPGIFDHTQTVTGLAAYNPGDAYAAGLRAVRIENAYGDDAPRLLMETDRNRAVRDLFDSLSSGEARGRRRYDIAHALAEQAKAADGTEIREHLLGYAHSSRGSELSASCYILGFLPPTQDVIAMVEALLDDNDAAVYEEACAAWHRLSSSRQLEELVEAFLAEENASRRWIYLEAALEAGDVGLSGQTLPIWLERMATKLTPLEWKYVADKMTDDRKKRDDDLKSAERLKEYE